MSAPSLPPAGDRKLVFLHLPKTGGTTLHHHFASHFAPNEVCPERFSRLHRMDPAEMPRYRFFSGHYNMQQVGLIPGPLFTVTVLRDPVERVLSNYYFWKRHPPGPATADPNSGPAVARANDLLGFLRSTSPQVQDSINNTMARYLAGGVRVAADLTYRFGSGCGEIQVSELEVLHRATGTLLSLDVVGFTPRLGDVYTRVAHAFGMKRVDTLARLNTREGLRPDLEPPPPEEPVTQEIRVELDRLTSVDRILFRLARQHFQAARR